MRDGPLIVVTLEVRRVEWLIVDGHIREQNRPVIWHPLQSLQHANRRSELFVWQLIDEFVERLSSIHRSLRNRCAIVARHPMTGRPQARSSALQAIT
jgi:hypothetical protein